MSDGNLSGEVTGRASRWDREEGERVSVLVG